ncbi:hypothetical protein [Endozoicomonas sp. Mp262]|uniref:hypothetical protein n=1 Tax=Endozoicomonas sp. Mp262 TaxID=2919499 RepID=UPI0021D87225
MAYPFQKSRKHLCANSLITTISESYEQIPDVRPNKDSRKITIHDASMSAFAMMHLKYPSLLSFERDKTEQEVRHNLEPAIPADLIKALNNKGCSLVASC